MSYIEAGVLAAKYKLTSGIHIEFGPSDAFPDVLGKFKLVVEAYRGNELVRFNCTNKVTPEEFETAAKVLFLNTTKWTKENPKPPKASLENSSTSNKVIVDKGKYLYDDASVAKNSASEEEVYYNNEQAHTR